MLRHRYSQINYDRHKYFSLMLVQVYNLNLKPSDSGYKPEPTAIITFKKASTKISDI